MNVLRPTVPLLVPYKDFTSPIPYSVIATAILPSGIPSITRDSLGIKLPDCS